MNKHPLSLTKKYFISIIALMPVFTYMQACNKVEKISPPVNLTASNEESNLATRNSPNIIVILADDLGYDAMPSSGNQTFETPNIDRMVNDGMRFTQCHAAPLCSPSRFMLVTGKYNFRNYNTGVLALTKKHLRTF